MQYLRLAPLKQGGKWCIYWKGTGSRIHIIVGEVAVFDEKLRKIKVIESIPGVFKKGILIDFDTIVQVKRPG